MKITTKLELKRYLSLMYFLNYKKPMMIFMSLFGILMLVGSLLYFFGIFQQFDSPPYFQLFFGITTVFVLPIGIYYGTKKSFESSERLHETIVYEFTEDRMFITGDSFKSELDWEKTYKVLEMKRWVMIYQNKLVANVIEKKYFGEGIDEFRSIVRKNNVRSKLRG